MPEMQVFSDGEIASYRKNGAILKACLAEVASRVTPGIATKELDTLAEAFIHDHGGKPAFKGYQGFPGTLCTSVNEECVHGIPGERVLREGDIVSLDCGVLLDGFYSDACVTVGVGQISEEAEHLLRTTASALAAAVDTLKAGVMVGDISAVIQATAESNGCHPVKSLTGHGLGRTLHLFPDIPNRGKAGMGAVFPVHTVVAVEPILSLGSDEIETAGDGWTLLTADHSLSAHFEHTLLVTQNGCEILA